jgi:hypothetical protein
VKGTTLYRSDSRPLNLHNLIKSKLTRVEQGLELPPNVHWGGAGMDYFWFGRDPDAIRMVTITFK